MRHRKAFNEALRVSGIDPDDMTDSQVVQAYTVGLCELIDMNKIAPSEEALLGLAAHIQDHCDDSCRLDLLLMLASRCEGGRQYLREVAQ